MARREVFTEAGGFNEEDFPVSYNDVDFCLRLRRRGYLIIYTPYALLYHDESATRGLNRYPHEEARLLDEWGRDLKNDYYYNPNLTLDGKAFAIDFSKPESLSLAISQELSSSTGTVFALSP
jgi:GT2 family glycosyltransferase